MQRVERIPAPVKTKKQPLLNTRQLCFFAAFVLPLSKLLETPSLLAQNALGDLLLPAFIQCAAQFIGLLCLLLVSEKTGKGVYSLLKEKVGLWAASGLYFLLAAYYLFSSLLPLLDLEKYTYAVFYDTAPSRFTFAPFFFFSLFVCMKSLRSFGRMTELCAPIFIVAFVGIIAASVGESDFEALLPWFEFPIGKIATAVKNTTLHFSDALLFLPLLENCEYKKGDYKKISGAFWLGVAFCLLFFAVFYGIYTSLAPRQHYAFSKIAQYFPALKTVGRVDLLLTYLLTIILALVTTLPLLLCVFCIKTPFGEGVGAIASIAVNVALFFFVLYCNKYYNGLYAFFQARLWWVFPAFSVGLPLLSPLLLIGKKKPRRSAKASAKEKQRGVNYAR